MQPQMPGTIHVHVLPSPCSMNPLGIKPERFTVAIDEEGSLLGFGQLEPKDGCIELRSMVVDTAHR